MTSHEALAESARAIHKAARVCVRNAAAVLDASTLRGTDNDLDDVEYAKTRSKELMDAARALRHEAEALYSGAAAAERRAWTTVTNVHARSVSQHLRMAYELRYVRDEDGDRDHSIG